MDPGDLWNMTIAASPALGALVAWRRARGVDASRARPTGPVLTSVEGLSDGARVTVSGRLVAASAPTEEGRVVALSTESKGGDARHATAEGLRLVLDDGRTEVPIEGLARVESGSREAPPWPELGDVAGATMAWVALLRGTTRELAAFDTRSVRVLLHDDRTLASGRLQVRPEGGDGAYREARVRYVMSPDGGAVSLFTAVARTRTSRRNVVRGALVAPVLMALLWTLAGVVALGLAGNSSHGTSFEGSRQYRKFRGRGEVARVALVSPLLRGYAHRIIADSLMDRRRPTAADLSGALGHLVAARECEAAVHVALERGRARDAERAIQRPECRERGAVRPWRHAEVAYAAGYFAEASERFDPRREPDADVFESYVDDPAFDVRLHLLAGDEALAARAASHRAARTWRGRATFVEEERRARTLECVADRFAAQRGDAEALRRLRRRALDRGARAECSALLLDVLDAPERRAWLAHDAQASTTRVGALLAWEGGRFPRGVLPCGEDWSRLLADPVGAMDARAPGLEHALLRTPGFDDSDDAWRAQVDLRCSVAAFEALAGDTRAARQHVGDAQARVGEATRITSAPWSVDATRGIALLKAVIDVMEGDDVAARRSLTRAGDDGPGLRRVEAFVNARERREGSIAFRGLEPPLAADALGGWDTVASGRPGRVADYLYERAWNGLPPWLLYGGGGSMGVGRSQVATWLEVTAPAPCLHCTVRRRLAELQMHALAARAYGGTVPDPALVSAVARALRERRLAVPLLVLDGLRSPVR